MAGRIYDRELNRLLDAGVEYREAHALAVDVEEEYFDRKFQEARDDRLERDR